MIKSLYYSILNVKKEEEMRLSIYLLNKTATEVKSLSTFIKSGVKRKSLHKESLSGYRKGLFFYEVYNPKSTWITQINSLLQKPVDIPKNEIFRGVLILQVNKRYFALSFNTGISLVKSEFIDYDFGFEIAKKTLDEKQISSYYSTDFTDHIINTKSDSSSSIPTYIINNPKKLSTVSSLSGKVSDSTKRIVGKYNLVVDFDDDLLETGLVPYLTELSNLYFDKRVKGLDFSNGLVPLKNKEEIENLDKKIFSDVRKWSVEVKKDGTLSASSLQNVTLNVTHDTDEEYFSGYVVSGLNSYPGKKGFFFSDFTKNSYFERLSNQISHKDLTQEYVINKLKRDTIWIVYEDKDDVKVGNVYSSLVITYPYDKENKAILIAGKWYLIASSYYVDLESKIKRYLKQYSDIELGGFSKRDTVTDSRGNTSLNESAYNERMASTHSLCLLDQCFYYYPEEIKKLNFHSHSKIEPCDLLKYDPNNKKLVLWHIKRGTNAAGISHLATQAEISTLLLSIVDQGKDFIEFINSQIEPVKIPTGIKKEDITIVLGITKKNPEKELRNNFTLLELKALEKVLTEIASQGFNVSLNLIKDNTK